jgi:flavin reductase (DIM6/NTAB) family NADH-FMN oxidoreductase RutF
VSEQTPLQSLVAEIDYPMFIVTASSGAEADGCLVGFVTQGSIHPGRFVVLLSKANRTFRIAAAAADLAVHFLHEGNRGLALLFGEQTGDDVDKLALCEWSRVDGIEAPVLAGTRGFVAGPILDRMDAGDHTAHLIDVTATRHDGDGRQLSYQMIKDLKPGHPA